MNLSCKAINNNINNESDLIINNKQNISFRAVSVKQSCNIDATEVYFISFSISVRSILFWINFFIL